MVYVDVHSHLDVEYFEKDLDMVITKSLNNDVKVIITCGIDSYSNIKTLKLCEKYNSLRASLGVYPSENLEKIDVDKEIKFIEDNKIKILAIGEIGLDYSYSDVKEEIQLDVFIKMLKLAKKLRLPVVVHSRNAEKKVIDILEELNVEKVVLHCFSGNKKLIKRAERLKYYFSIPCNVVRSQHFQNLIKLVNINQLLTESDSPYLGPEKDKRNDPSNIPLVVEKIAQIKGFEQEEVENNIFMNYQRLFL